MGLGMPNYPKVGILCPIEFNLPPDKYGPWELVCYNLAEALVQLGVDVTVYATKKAQTVARVEYIWDQPIENMPYANRSALTTIHIIDALKKAKSVDIIHNSLNIHPVLYADLIDKPMITTLHGAACEQFNHDYYEYLKDRNFISISNTERDFYPSLNYLDTVYNGVDFNQYGLKSGKNSYLFFSGRLVKEKGILTAIEISQKTNIPLIIAGVVTDQQFFDQFVLPHVDNKLIKCLGHLQAAKLYELLRDALALVALVEWNEPFGLSILDALATGVPVIGSAMGSLPELIYDQQMGMIVNNVDEAVARMGEMYTKDPTVCREGARAKFSREAMAQRYLENYLKVV